MTGITRVFSNDDESLEPANVLGGEAFFFCCPECEQAFRWIFVDAARPVSLANMVAIPHSARNIVLAGDPRQLLQVIQGAQLHSADLSCLDQMVFESATLPAKRGIFLPDSRPMHPGVCAFLSCQVYQGRLTSQAHTVRQRVTGTSPQRPAPSG